MLESKEMRTVCSSFMIGVVCLFACSPSGVRAPDPERDPTDLTESEWRLVEDIDSRRAEYCRTGESSHFDSGPDDSCMTASRMAARRDIRVAAKLQLRACRLYARAAACEHFVSLASSSDLGSALNAAAESMAQRGCPGSIEICDDWVRLVEARYPQDSARLEATLRIACKVSRDACIELALKFKADVDFDAADKRYSKKAEAEREQSRRERQDRDAEIEDNRRRREEDRQAIGQAIDNAARALGGGNAGSRALLHLPPRRSVESRGDRSRGASRAIHVRRRLRATSLTVSSKTMHASLARGAVASNVMVSTGATPRARRVLPKTSSGATSPRRRPPTF